MGGVIEETKGRILEIVKKTNDAPYPNDGWKLRLGFVAYKDFKSNPQFLVQDFTSSTSVFSAALAKIKAGGGDDVPEDVFGGLELSTMLSWESVSRTMIHIADAPCHGTKYHDLGSGGDNYAAGDPLQRDIKEIFTALKKRCKVSSSCVSLDQNLWIVRGSVSTV